MPLPHRWRTTFFERFAFLFAFFGVVSTLENVRLATVHDLKSPRVSCRRLTPFGSCFASRNVPS